MNIHRNQHILFDTKRDQVNNLIVHTNGNPQYTGFWTSFTVTGGGKEITVGLYSDELESLIKSLMKEVYGDNVKISYDVD